MAIGVLNPEIMSFQQNNPVMSGMDLANQIAQGMMQNKMGAAQLPYAPLLAKVNAAQKITDLNLSPYKYYANLLNGMSGANNSFNNTQAAFNTFLSTPQGQAFAKTNPEVVSQLISGFQRQASQISNGLNPAHISSLSMPQSNIESTATSFGYPGLFSNMSGQNNYSNPDINNMPVPSQGGQLPLTTDQQSKLIQAGGLPTNYTDQQKANMVNTANNLQPTGQSSNSSVLNTITSGITDPVQKKMYLDALNEANKKAQIANTTMEYMKGFDSAYKKSNFTGPSSNFVPDKIAHLLDPNSQTADSEAAQIGALATQAFRANPTNLDLHYITENKINRNMSSDTERHIYNTLLQSQSWNQEYPMFLSKAMQMGIPKTEADNIFNLYQQQRASVDPDTGKLISKNQNSWNDFLTPAALNSIRSGKVNNIPYSSQSATQQQASNSSFPMFKDSKSERDYVSKLTPAQRVAYAKERYQYGS